MGTDPDDPLGLGLDREADPDEVIDLVASVGPLDVVVVQLREFLHRSGAVRAVAIVEDGPAIVDVAQLMPIEVSFPDRVVHLPHAIELDAVPVGVPDVRQLPRFEVKRDAAEIAGPMGGMEHYAEAVRGLALAIGDRAVAMATFSTDDPEAPLSISARGSDPIVIALGDEEHEMESGWPAPRRPAG